MVAPSTGRGAARTLKTGGTTSEREVPVLHIEDQILLWRNGKVSPSEEPHQTTDNRSKPGCLPLSLARAGMKKLTFFALDFGGPRSAVAPISLNYDELLQIYQLDVDRLHDMGTPDRREWTQEAGSRSPRSGSSRRRRPANHPGGVDCDTDGPRTVACSLKCQPHGVHAT